MLDQVRLDHHLGIEPLAMLRRDEHTLDLDRPLMAVLVDVVPDRHLRLPSGRRYGSTSDLRTSDSRRAILCASMIGSGISSGVSFVA